MLASLDTWAGNEIVIDTKAVGVVFPATSNTAGCSVLWFRAPRFGEEDLRFRVQGEPQSVAGALSAADAELTMVQFRRSERQGNAPFFVNPTKVFAVTDDSGGATLWLALVDGIASIDVESSVTQAKKRLVKGKPGVLLL